MANVRNPAVLASIVILAALLTPSLAAPQASAGGGLSFTPPKLPLFERGQAFRISLCTGELLRADQPSPRCLPSSAKTVTGGHNADYVFTTPSGTFLPPGLTVDAFGVLHGTGAVDLSTVVLNICVRQLNETDSCQPVGFGDNSPQAQAQKAKGPSVGKIVGGVTAAAGGAAAGGYAYKKYQEYQAEQQGTSSGGSSNRTCTQLPTSCTSNSQCTCSNRCSIGIFAGGVCVP
jgi:hypothetical protein